jgi:hypothetical protein
MPTLANDNLHWWKAHLLSQTVAYGNWTIAYNPPPIPVRSCDWQYCHNDFDGAEDACDNRHGSAPTLAECLNEIDDYEEERFDECGCEHGCPYGLLQMASACLKHDRCVHRDEVRSRDAVRDALRAAQDPSHAG